MLFKALPAFGRKLVQAGDRQHETTRTSPKWRIASEIRLGTMAGSKSLFWLVVLIEIST
jgi:hypothetical protein